MGNTISQEIIEKELAELKTALKEKSLLDVAVQVQQELALLENTTLNIAITGLSGTGKSSLVNALRGVRDDEEGAAKTGPVETTMEHVGYPHPAFSNVIVWDLPGTGTPEFKPDEYLERVNFSQYDFFIIVSGDRFTVHDADLAREIRKRKRKFYFVRTKIDFSLDCERRKQGFDEKATLEKIRNYCCENLRKTGESSSKVFLISNSNLGVHDFSLLQKAIEKDLDNLKRQVLIMALPMYLKEVLEKKKAAMESLIWKKALKSSAFGAVPVPGLSFDCDLAILEAAMKQICHVFGLDEGSLQKFAKVIGKPVDELKAVIKKSSQAGEITTEFTINILLVTEPWATLTVLKTALAVIPVLGSLAGAGLSFVTTFCMLKSFLKDVVEDTENVIAKVVELSKKCPK